jgi:outer membrane lipoprotein-sorting protein
MNSDTKTPPPAGPEPPQSGARSRRPLLRWAVPAGVTAVVLGAGGIANMIPANAEEPLPPRSAEQLLLDVQDSLQTNLSGTVVQRTDIGLPELPRSGSSDLASLISGNHTLRLWYAGPQKVRVALLGALEESDVIRNGRDTWIWSSRDKTVTHTVLPDAENTLEQEQKARRSTEELLGSSLPSPSELTPQAAAKKILEAVDPTTVVSTAGPVKVAGERAYELVLSPKDSVSLIGQVRIAVEAAHHVPVRLQVFPGNDGSPAFEVAFTQISFDRPSDRHFRFTAPPGAEQRDLPPETQSGQADEQSPEIVGQGWTAVLTGRVSGDLLQKLLSGGLSGTAPGAADPDSGHSSSVGALATDRLFQAFESVSGSWGKGRLLKTVLCSVLLVDDGRFYAGAVRPEALYQTAAAPLPSAGDSR